MITSIFSFLGSAASAVAAWFGYSSQQSTLDNTAAMEKNKQAQADQAEINRINQDLAAKDPSGIEKDIEP
jgi:hypothetical protein